VLHIATTVNLLPQRNEFCQRAIMGLPLTMFALSCTHPGPATTSPEKPCTENRSSKSIASPRPLDMQPTLTTCEVNVWVQDRTLSLDELPAAHPRRRYSLSPTQSASCGKSAPGN
jgi:hypothetical protein